jgi:hypothetical protein
VQPSSLGGAGFLGGLISSLLPIGLLLELRRTSHPVIHRPSLLIRVTHTTPLYICYYIHVQKIYGDVPSALSLDIGFAAQDVRSCFMKISVSSRFSPTSVSLLPWSADGHIKVVSKTLQPFGSTFNSLGVLGLHLHTPWILRGAVHLWLQLL